MQKESLLFFSFPSDSNFSKGKVTKKREKCKRKPATVAIDAAEAD